jgi:pimeloyl-ACP methyl ester carboxylesterase
LQSHYRIIAIDIPGRGRSGWLKNPLEYNNLYYAQIVMRFLLELGITQCHWLGTSMGGLVAMMLNHLQPGLMQRLVINDIGPYLPQTSIERIAAYAGNRPVFLHHTHAKQYFKNMYVSFGITNEAHFDHIAQHSVRENAAGQMILHFDPAIVEPFKLLSGQGDVNLWPLWPGMAMPCLVLRGGASDLLMPDTLAQMHALKPDLRSVEIPGCGHAPALMDPAQIALVKNYLLER